MASKYEDPVNYFDMDLKGVYKINKTAHLRLNQYIKKLEKQEDRCMVKMDHDIRETKRSIAKIEDEKNKLVMKLLKSYVNKTTQKKTKRSRIPGSVGQSRSDIKTGFTFSTYRDTSVSDSVITPAHLPSVNNQRPVSIHIPLREDKKSRGIPEGKAVSEFELPFRKQNFQEHNHQDVQTRVSKSNDKRTGLLSRTSNRTRHSNRLDIPSRISSKRDVLSRASKVSDLPATRGHIAGQEHSIQLHVQKVKDFLGGNTCLYRGHPPARGYNVDITPRQDKGFPLSDIDPEANIKPGKLLERIKIFGNIKIPSKLYKSSFDSRGKGVCDSFRRRKPTLPLVLSEM